MSVSNVVTSPDGHTQVRTYTGITANEAQVAFAADRAEAKRQGWVAVSQRWDASQPIPTLVIEYRHWSGPRRRSRSRWPAIGTVVVAAVVLLVMAAGNDGEDGPLGSGSVGDPAQPGAVIVPERASTPRPARTTRPVAPAPMPDKDEPEPTNVRRVTKADFGKRWPFKVDFGTLGCDRDAATFTDPRGRVWAINGVGMHRGLPELDDSIWRDDQGIIAAFREAFPKEKPPRVKVSVGEMIDLALELCE